MDKQRTRGTLEMTAAMLISGTIGWFVLMSGQAAVDVVFWRCVFATLCLTIVCHFMGVLKPGTISRTQLALTIVGGIALVSNWTLLFAAYSSTSISIATAVYNTQPFILLGFGALFLGERITLAKLVWLALAFAGVVLIVQAQPSDGASRGRYIIGIGLSLGAAFFYAVASLVAKKLKGVPPHLIALIQVMTGLVLLAPLAHFSNLPKAPHEWGSLITLGTVHTALMFGLYYGAVQKLPTHLVGSLSFIYPMAAIAVDYAAFGHRLNLWQIAGAALILIAAIAMNQGWTLWKAKTLERAPL
jgi:drug/metabolite transporter (DMT)-like permease